MRAYEECLIECEYDYGEWRYAYSSFPGGSSNVTVPSNSPIYGIKDELEILTLLTHSEPIERNGLTILFVQKGTMELINPIQIER